MMRLWRETYVRPVRRGPSIAMSVAVHTGLIGAGVIATAPPPGMAPSLYEVANRVVYIAPPIRVPRAEGSTARLRYVEDAPVGPGSGFARAATPLPDTARSEQLAVTDPGDLGREQINTVEAERLPGKDSVFTIIEVDSAVTTDPSSAAPVYPAALLKAGIEGIVQVRYVVDSTGLANPATLEVVNASRPEFIAAVREALPGMRFTPARIGSRRVNQLVEQGFNFKIAKAPADSLAGRGKKPPG
jgi:hypothetical protein